MKKLLSVILAVCLCLGLCSCAPSGAIRIKNGAFAITLEQFQQKIDEAVEADGGRYHTFEQMEVDYKVRENNYRFHIYEGYDGVTLSFNTTEKGYIISVSIIYKFDYKYYDEEMLGFYLHAIQQIVNPGSTVDLKEKLRYHEAVSSLYFDDGPVDYSHSTDKDGFHVILIAPIEAFE